METVLPNVMGYKLIMNKMDPKQCTVLVTAGDANGKPVTLIKKENLYLLDAIFLLEDYGCDPYETQLATEVMEQEGHDTANFGMLGTFLYSEYNGVRQ